MARGRIIDASISQSRKVNSVSDQAALLFTWIQPHTDDFGRIEGESEDILFRIVPRRGWDINQLEEYLKELFTIGLLKMYHDDKNKRYFEVYDFDEHQIFRSDRSRKPKYPIPVSYCNGWYTNDTQVAQIDTEVKLSKVKLSISKVNGSETVIGKPMTTQTNEIVDVKNFTPKEKAIRFFEGVNDLNNKIKDVAWLREFLIFTCEKNNIDKKVLWGEIITFTSYWTELNSTGTKQRWQTERTFEVERRLTTWFGRAGFKGFHTSMAFNKKPQGKTIIGLEEETYGQ